MSKCSKLIGIVASIVLVAGMAFADVTSDIATAKVLYVNKDYAEAQAAFEKVIKDYPTATVNILANAQSFVGYSLRSQGKHVEAQVAFEKVIKDYPTASVGILANAQRCAGYSLRSQGKHAEATEAYVKAVILYVRVPNVVSKTLIDTFSLINPALMTTADYTVALQDIIKATPATEANAEFLGRIKSELEKMK